MLFYVDFTLFQLDITCLYKSAQITAWKFASLTSASLCHITSIRKTQVTHIYFEFAYEYFKSSLFLYDGRNVRNEQVKGAQEKEKYPKSDSW